MSASTRADGNGGACVARPHHHHHSVAPIAVPPCEACRLLSIGTRRPCMAFTAAERVASPRNRSRITSRASSPAPARRGRARRLAAVDDRGKMRCPCHDAAEIACVLGGARRQGRVWRCLCPLHGGHSLLRAMAVKFNLTMAAYDLIRLPKLNRYPTVTNSSSPGLNHITAPLARIFSGLLPN
jgi:hypothetical protein